MIIIPWGAALLQSLKDRFYWRRDVCKLAWDVDVDSQIIVAAPFGGVIACTRDQSKLSLLRMSASVIPTIDIYTCAGKREEVEILWLESLFWGYSIKKRSRFFSINVQQFLPTCNISIRHSLSILLLLADQGGKSPTYHGAAADWQVWAGQRAKLSFASQTMGRAYSIRSTESQFRSSASAERQQ